jgi:hypothetical protein
VKKRSQANASFDPDQTKLWFATVYLIASSSANDEPGRDLAA